MQYVDFDLEIGPGLGREYPREDKAIILFIACACNALCYN